MLNRRSDLDQVAVRIIEPNNLLSPTVLHQPVDVPDFRIVLFQLFNKSFYVRLLEIQLTGIALPYYISAQKILPYSLILQDKSLCQDHITVIIKDHFQSE